jgi:hypothetical protein
LIGVVVVVSTEVNFASRGRLLKTGEVAELLHVSAQTVRDWAAAGRLVPHVSASGHRKFFEADVRRLMLEDKGVVSYHAVWFYVVLTYEGDVYWVGADFEPTFGFEASEHTFARAWSYNNGLQVEPHKVCLGESGVVVTPGETRVGLCAFEGQNAVFLPVTSVALTQEEAVAKLWDGADEVGEFLKANFVPKPAYDWFGLDGVQVQE